MYSILFRPHIPTEKVELSSKVDGKKVLSLINCC